MLCERLERSPARRETRAAVCHRRIVRWFPLLLVACGSAAPPAPAPINRAAIGRAAIAPVVPKQPVPPAARVTCADVGVILRGGVEDHRKAGPAKEAAIASVCLFDHWSQEILDCVGGERDAKQCLDKLTTEQRAALDTKLTNWTVLYEGETWDTAEDERLASEPPEIECSGIITHGNVATLAPALGPLGEERTFAASVRRFAVTAACEAWPHPVRACVQDGLSLTTCRARLETGLEQVLAGKLATIEALMTKIAVIKKKPTATYDCKAVVAAHYSDAAWRGKAESPKNPKATRVELAKQATERKQMIVDSRKAMLEACTAEAWNPTLRACELVESGELCAKGAGRTTVRWGFPANSVIARTGIVECDAYIVSLQTVLTCDKVPTATKDAIKQGYDAMREGLIVNATTAEARRLASTTCKQADEGMRQAASALGCLP